MATYGKPQDPRTKMFLSSIYKLSRPNICEDFGITWINGGKSMVIFDMNVTVHALHGMYPRVKRGDCLRRNLMRYGFRTKKYSDVFTHPEFTRDMTQPPKLCYGNSYMDYWRKYESGQITVKAVKVVSVGGFEESEEEELDWSPSTLEFPVFQESNGATSSTETPVEELPVIDNQWLEGFLKMVNSDPTLM